MIDNKELRRLAEKATQGEWQFCREGWNVTVIGEDDFGISVYEPESEENMTGEFIAAANPSAILSLLDHIEQLEAEIARLRKDALRYQWATALEDNAEILYSVLLCHGGDKHKIDERIDFHIAPDTSTQEVR